MNINEPSTCRRDLLQVVHTANLSGDMLLSRSTCRQKLNIFNFWRHVQYKLSYFVARNNVLHRPIYCPIQVTCRTQLRLVDALVKIYHGATMVYHGATMVYHGKS